jgi:4-hydroxythreonine-4-phosphate dehydrogenase
VEKPVVGITMGDAAGIGPEIVVTALSDPEVYEACDPLIIGDAKALRRAEIIVGTGAEIRPVADPSEAVFRRGTIDCLDLDLLPPGMVPFGRVSAEAGDAAYRYVERAVLMALDGRIDAICTAPLNKEAMQKGGHPYPGHTEILAELTGTEDFAMMFLSPKLKVILATIHVGLVDAVEMLNPGLVHRTIRLADETLKKAGLEKPRIGVCGVNPHAGEGGMFGRGEEEEKVVPAVQRAGKEGLDVDGPLPADTLFYRAVRGDFDVVVAMYHDQGLGPVKTLGLEAAVNVTVGLPIVRTSVDHGTAFDIAGKGIADETNMKVAILRAAELAPVQKRESTPDPSLQVNAEGQGV